MFPPILNNLSTVRSTPPERVGQINNTLITSTLDSQTNDEFIRSAAFNKPLLFGIQLNENQKAQKRPEALCFEDFQTQLTQLGWDTKTLLEQSVQEKNKLGKGGEAVAFSIPGIEDYVIRVQYGRNGDLGKLKKKKFPTEPLTKALDEFPDLNIGQAIAQIGNIKVLKRQTGQTLDLRQYKDNESEYIKRYTALSAKIAALPPEAFEKLAEIHVRVKEKGYNVDTHETNTFLDTATQAINIIDVKKEIFPPQLSVLGLLQHFIGNIPQSVQHQANLIAYRKIIALHILNAALKHHIPLHEPQFTSLQKEHIFWKDFYRILYHSGLLEKRSEIIEAFKQQDPTILKHLTEVS